MIIDFTQSFDDTVLRYLVTSTKVLKRTPQWALNTHTHIHTHTHTHTHTHKDKKRMFTARTID